jgi:transposase
VLNVETLAKIRQRYYVKKQSISQIARELHLARNTVKKALRRNQTEATYQRLNQPYPKLGPYAKTLDQWLQEEQQLPIAQRCRATKLHQRLQALGYDGAYDSVQRYVKRWQEAAGKQKPAFIPLSFAPGEAYQFDWSEETVELSGVVQKVSVAHFRLCYSRLFFVVAYVRESQEMLFDAHQQALAYFGGIPLRGIYDNLKTAVDSVFGGKERQFNRRFLQLMSHYLVEPTACTPGAGWEKGQVENQVNTIRHWLFVPRLKFADLANLNQHLAERCQQLAKSHPHPEYPEHTVWAIYEQERNSLQPLVLPFEAYSERECKVSSTCLVQYDRNRYSVDCRYAHQTVSLRAYATRIVLVADNQIVGEHVRHFGRNHTVYNPLHYLALLDHKPGALRNGTPFKVWELPKPVDKIRAQLMKQPGGDAECVKILQAIVRDGLEAVTVACELALNDGMIRSDYVLNLLSRLRPTPSLQVVETPATLKLHQEPIANCQRYNSLLSEASYATH